MSEGLSAEKTDISGRGIDSQKYSPGHGLPAIAAKVDGPKNIDKVTISRQV